VTDAQRALVTAIHAAPTMLVYEFSGAGVQALADLHAVGGSSRTVLEATDRYATSARDEATGGHVEKAVSPEVARRMAEHAFARAQHLAGPGVHVVGVACTATIATDRVKRGEHGVCVAAVSAVGRHELALGLGKGARDRQAEEAVVSHLVLMAVADACGVLRRAPPELVGSEAIEEGFVPSPLFAELVDGRREVLALDMGGRLRTGLDLPSSGVALVSGAFNPLHDGHLGLATAAQAHLGRPAAFELALANAEKPTIEAREGYRRAMQFPGRAPLFLTRAALFSHKARLFPGAVFVLGADTAARVLSPRFYGGPGGLDAALDDVRAQGSRFLVAGRRFGERFVTLSDLPVPSRHADLFEALPASAFRSDASSTAIRERWAEDPGAPA
jgi:hypothetical protein